jgi:hypothetical protein
MLPFKFGQGPDLTTAWRRLQFCGPAVAKASLGSCSSQPDAEGSEPRAVDWRAEVREVECRPRALLVIRVGRRKRRVADAAHQSCVVDPQPDRSALIPALHATLHAADAEKILESVLNSSQVRAAPNKLSRATVQLAGLVRFDEVDRRDCFEDQRRIKPVSEAVSLRCVAVPQASAVGWFMLPAPPTGVEAILKFGRIIGPLEPPEDPRDHRPGEEIWLKRAIVVLEVAHPRRRGRALEGPSLEGKIKEEQPQRADRGEGRPASQARRPSSACSASSAKIPPCTGRAWKPYT